MILRQVGFGPAGLERRERRSETRTRQNGPWNPAGRLARSARHGAPRRTAPTRSAGFEGPDRGSRSGPDDAGEPRHDRPRGREDHDHPDSHDHDDPRSGRGPGRRLRPRPAAPRRWHPVQHGGRLRPSHLRHVGRRPDGGADDPAPGLRLAAPRTPRERPPHLLQGTRLPTAVRDVPRRRRRHRAGAGRDLPARGQPPGGPPHPGLALGGRRDRVAGPGHRDRGRRRAGGDAGAATVGAGTPGTGRRMPNGRRTGCGSCAATARWPRARSGRRWTPPGGTA